MAYPNKIDNEKLQRLIAAGKFVDEIAKECGVVETSIRVRAKKLGLTLNDRRKHVGVSAKPSAPVPAPIRGSSVDATYKRFSPPSPSMGEGSGGGDMPVQIIPVTLRLTVEVNVRVSAQGGN